MTLSSLAGLLFDVTLRSSALLVLAFGINRVLRGSSAAIRHLIWAAALGGAVALPLLSAILPPLRLRLPAPIGSIFVTGPDGAAAAAEGSSNGSPIHSGVPADGAAGGIAAETVLEWAILLWIAGMVLVSSRLILGLIATWRLGRQSSMVTDGGWLHLAHDIAHRLGATRGVTLLRGQEGNVPMTWGVLRPVIWLPIDAESWTDERRKVVLAHELAHVRRADAFTQWVGHLATVVFWFNPLVWVAVRRLHDERERACDDAVLRLGTPSVRYADHLLDVARMVGRRPGASAAMAMARHSPLEGRMHAILDRSMARDSVAWGRGVVITAVAVGLILPMAALQPEGQAQVPFPGNTRTTGSPTASAEASLRAVNPSGSLGVPTREPASPDSRVTAGPGTTRDLERGTPPPSPIPQDERGTSDEGIASFDQANSVGATPAGAASSSSSSSGSSTRSGSTSASQSSSGNSGGSGAAP